MDIRMDCQTPKNVSSEKVLVCLNKCLVNGHFFNVLGRLLAVVTILFEAFFFEKVHFLDPINLG